MYLGHAEIETKFGLNSVMKVYTVSDLHVDYPENMDWILSLNSTAYLEDILVLAGDVSNDLEDLIRVFNSLKSKFKAVHFIPGNHELWVEKDKLNCSLEKFEAVRGLCASLDVELRTVHYEREQLDISNEVVISYSHFLPRIDVMPSYIPEDRRRIYPVLGSDLLGEQVKQLNPDIHIYGHSHVNQSVELENIRYINNAFARPTEHQIARKQLHCVLELDS